MTLILLCEYTHALNEVLLAFLSVHMQINKYTLAAIQLPCTTISCLTSCSAIMCFHDRLHTKQQHSILSSAWTHHFFITLKVL